MTRQGTVKLYFPHHHHLSQDLIQLERHGILHHQYKHQVWFTPPTSNTEEEENETSFVSFIEDPPLKYHEQEQEQLKE